MLRANAPVPGSSAWLRECQLPPSSMGLVQGSACTAAMDSAGGAGGGALVICSLDIRRWPSFRRGSETDTHNALVPARRTMGLVALPLPLYPPGVQVRGRLVLRQVAGQHRHHLSAALNRSKGVISMLGFYPSQHRGEVH